MTFFLLSKKKTRLFCIFNNALLIEFGVFSSPIIVSNSVAVFWLSVLLFNICASIISFLASSNRNFSARCGIIRTNVEIYFSTVTMTKFEVDYYLNVCFQNVFILANIFFMSKKRFPVV